MIHLYESIYSSILPSSDLIDIQIVAQHAPNVFTKGIQCFLSFSIIDIFKTQNKRNWQSHWSSKSLFLQIN